MGEEYTNDRFQRYALFCYYDDGYIAIARKFSLQNMKQLFRTIDGKMHIEYR